MYNTIILIVRMLMTCLTAKQAITDQNKIGYVYNNV